MSLVSRFAPGLLVVLAIAAIARFSTLLVPTVVGEVLVAVLLGIIVGNVFPLGPRVRPGVQLAVQRILRLGIVLLGARLSLGAVVAVGADALGLVLACMAIGLAIALGLGRVMRLPPRLALLIGVGTVVCGNSAIIATAPVIKANEREVSFAVSTITLFGTLAVFVYPLVGRAIGLSDPAFGLWSGVSVNDTSQVVAASAAYSPEARDIATVVKLVRNALMAPLIILVAWWWSRQVEIAEGDLRGGVKRAVPLFVFGFLALAILRTLGVLDPAVVRALDQVAQVCILMALAGVGLSTRLSHMRDIGLRPFYAGLGTATLLTGLSLAAIVGLGLGPQPR